MIFNQSSKKKKGKILAFIFTLWGLILGSYLIHEWWYEEAVTWIFLILAIMGGFVFIVGLYHAIKNTYKDIFNK